MSLIRVILCSCIFAYAICWLKLFWPVVPYGGKKKYYYQERLDLLIALLKELKLMGDCYADGGVMQIIAKLGLHHNFQKSEYFKARFPYEWWPALRQHIEYTVNKYTKISKLCVMVTKNGPAGMNLPFVPGVIIADFAFLNADLGFACDIFLHETYHDFYIGHGKRVKSIDGMWDIDIPLRRNLAEPADLFGVLEAGAFNNFVLLLRSYVNERGDSLWNVACEAAQLEAASD